MTVDADPQATSHDADERAFVVLVRQLAPRVLGALLRRYGGLAICEDATQEALIAASVRWRRDGVPANAFGWLYAVASRKVIDQVRSHAARRERELGQKIPEEARLDGRTIDADPLDHDDSLDVLVLCCHPALSPASQIVLTLRAVAGLTTAEIARAFFVPEATMTRRITRAKETIQQAGATFPPAVNDRAGRMASVRHVLYLLFNEGHTASEGDTLARHELVGEAIRLTRMTRAAEPQDAELAGLLGLMVLSEARGAARLDDSGALVTLERQDRRRWDAALVAEGVALAEEAVAAASGPGPFALQAAIAALHTESASVESTDWPQILALYDLLVAETDNPMARLGRAVAVAEVRGPEEALRAVHDLEADSRLVHHHRLLSVRAHLLERLGRSSEAREQWLRAAAGAGNAVERQWLTRKGGAEG